MEPLERNLPPLGPPSTSSVPRREGIRNYPVDLDVNEEDVGQPIDRFLRRRLESDPPHVAKLLRQKRVTFLPASSSTDRLQELSGEASPVDEGGGAIVPVRGWELPGLGVVHVEAREGGRPAPQPNRRIHVNILMEDDDLVVVDKPSGLATHPGPRHGNDTLLNVLIAKYPSMAELGPDRGYGLVHRLDRETSGLLIAAKSELAYDSLVDAFAKRRVDKRYVAFADASAGGDAESLVIDTPIRGKEARTDVEVVRRVGPVAQLSIRPHSGRMHQIRIHLSEAGWPVLRDERYGRGADDLTAKLYMKRLALHAERIHFLHPRTGEPVSLELPIPRDLRHSWKRAIRVFQTGPTSDR